MPIQCRIGLCLFFVLFSIVLQAQREGDVWCFGKNATLQFNGGIFPVQNTLVALEGCSSISDSVGNLLFYTNGEVVCDKFGVPMPNGSGLLGSSTSSQSAIILKQPGVSNIYYVFTVDNNYSLSTEIGNGFRFSIVDMSLNGGNGDVTVKNILIRKWAREKLTAVRHANESEFWVLINDWIEDDIFAYRFNCNGLDTVPVKSSIGPFHNYTVNTFGCMKASLDGRRLALANWDINTFSVLDFDNNSGKASNRINITGPSTNGSAYGVEFSPNGRFLYGTTIIDPKLIQFDLSFGDGNVIGNTATILSTHTTLTDFGFSAYFGSLQLGPDGKIYSANWADTVLGVIQNPNQPGLSCNYVGNAITLASSKSYLGLPNILSSYILNAPVDTSFAQLCVNASYMLPDGIMVDSPGVYTSILTGSSGCDSIVVTKLEAVVTRVDTGTGIYICQGGSAQLNATGGITYTWIPTTALSDPNISNPIASPAVTTTYTVLIKAPVLNIIANGDFSNGNSSFSSGYLPESPPNTVEGTYYVGVNPLTWNAGMTDCADHSTGDGNMMLVNGATTPNVNVWCQTVNVLPNTDYAFSTWVQTLTPGNPAQLQFSINSVLLGSVFNAPEVTCNWAQFYQEWNSGLNTTATICIVNQNTINLANDFALDDISFSALCDAAIHKVTVNVGDIILKTIDTTTCKWEGYTLPDGEKVFDSGIYIDTIFASTGCDTLYRVVLNVTNYIERIIDTTICYGSGFKLADGSIVYSSGNYTDTLLSSSGCDTVVTINLTVNNLIKDSIAVENTDCSNGQKGNVEITANGGEPPYIYSLLNIDTNTTGYFADLLPGTYNYKVYDNNGCAIDGVTVIGQSNLLTIDVSPELSNIDIGDIVNYIVTTNNSFADIKWTPSTFLSCDTCRSTISTPTRSIVYTVTAQVDGLECVATTTVKIVLDDARVLMPNAFTPNGDGNNDFIKLLYYGDVQLEFYRIYNRWGELIFETDEITKGWDGRYKGVDQPAGVYVYYIRYSINGGSSKQIKSLKGSVTLIR